ncbi:MAG: DUF6471 domain-containing protein [Desulfuromonadaceae bacterium]|nr:DUF6471 domain-containing protein [Desulfuromonadaceae bacterium]
MRLDVVLVNLTGKESARAILRSELARREITHHQLTDLLIAQGVKITKAAVDNRITRGAFSADFFIESLRAIGCLDIGLFRE